MSRPEPSRQSDGPQARGDRAAAAFSLLGNETRLEILLAIWTDQRPLAPDNAVPFTRIFDSITLADRGNVSYHLDELEGRFITRHPDGEGYELLIPGLKLVRSVVAGTGIDDHTLAPTEIDQPCPLCGAGTTISYREGVVFLRCTECPGMAPGKAEIDGVLNAIYFEPAGLADRTPEELHAASLAAELRQAHALFDGVCPTCSGRVEGRLECCTDHEPIGGCDNCGLRLEAWGRYRCGTCKYFGGGNPKKLALFHPEIVAFYADHDVSVRVEAGDFESARRVHALIYDYELELLSTEPPRVAVTASIDDDAVRVTFDETASVVDVQR